jgi:Protein of unknown function (DUF1302)
MKNRSGNSMCWMRRSGSLKPIASAAALLCMFGISVGASAGEIELANDDVKMRWDNTIKYSAGYRLKSPSATLTADPNQDDGNRNFKKGLISNRFDLLSELDVAYKKDYGFRVSAAAWNDDVYKRTNDNDSAATANNSSVASNAFNDRTRTLHGQKVDLLDAFAYANGNVNELPANVRLGRHTVLYGESLFFGNNGIANGQAPMDIIKLLSVPGSQFKEIARPVNQVSSQVQLTDRVSLGGYYQFKWEETRIPSAGSYFSNADVLEGGERFFLPPAFGGGFLTRGADMKPKNSGQGGAQIRWRPEGRDVELGFYATQYHDKVPQVYLMPMAGDYRIAYAGQNTKAYGLSASGQVGEANVSGEVSVRRDAALVSDPAILMNSANDNFGNPAYAIGNSVHAQVSSIYILQPSKLWGSASFLGELAWNQRTSITQNPNAIAANSSKDAWAMRMIFTPTWYQVAGTGVDLSLPVGLGYSAKGNSSVVANFNPSGRKGGDLSIGLQGAYQQVWRFGVNYTTFFGEEGTALNNLGQLSFKQTYKDRDFVSVYVQHSF